MSTLNGQALILQVLYKKPWNFTVPELFHSLVLYSIPSAKGLFQETAFTKVVKITRRQFPPTLAAFADVFIFI